MRRASIAALKARLSEYVDAAKAGEEVIVTDRNKPVARLGPVTAPIRVEAQLIGLIRAGLARPAARVLPRKFWERPRPRDGQALALAALIEERRKVVKFWDASALVPLGLISRRPFGSRRCCRTLIEHHELAGRRI